MSAFNELNGDDLVMWYKQTITACLAAEFDSHKMADTFLMTEFEPEIERMAAMLWILRDKAAEHHRDIANDTINRAVRDYDILAAHQRGVYISQLETIVKDLASPRALCTCDDQDIIQPDSEAA